MSHPAMTRDGAEVSAVFGIMPTGAQGAGLLVLLAAVGAIVGAWVFEYGLGLPPCDLCFTQRYPWWVAGGLAGLALVLPQVRPLLVAGALLAVAVGAGVAGYHAGIEQGWWPGPSSCTGTHGEMPATAADLLRMLEGDARIVACDEIPWSIFGLSIAALNGLFAAATVLAGLLLWRLGAKTA